MILPINQSVIQQGLMKPSQEEEQSDELTGIDAFKFALSHLVNQGVEMMEQGRFVEANTFFSKGLAAVRRLLVDNDTTKQQDDEKLNDNIITFISNEAVQLLRAAFQSSRTSSMDTTSNDSETTASQLQSLVDWNDAINLFCRLQDTSSSPNYCHYYNNNYGSENNDTCQSSSSSHLLVYKHPIFVLPHEATTHSLNGYSFFLTYNLGLSTHLDSLLTTTSTVAERVKKTGTALRIYNLAYTLYSQLKREWSNNIATSLFLCAIVNNVGCIYKGHKQEKAAMECFQQLVSMSMVIFEHLMSHSNRGTSNATTNQNTLHNNCICDTFRSFFQSIIPILIKSTISAPAA